MQQPPTIAHKGVNRLSHTKIERADTRSLPAFAGVACMPLRSTHKQNILATKTDTRRLPLFYTCERATHGV